MKDKLRKKIILGISSAVFLSQQVVLLGAGLPQSNPQVLLTSEEQAFLRKLSGNAVTVFKNMDHPTRAYAMKILLHNCKGQNACKGQGGCKTTAHACKGQNACNAQGGCRVVANDAVFMAQKRQGS